MGAIEMRWKRQKQRQRQRRKKQDKEKKAKEHRKNYKDNKFKVHKSVAFVVASINSYKIKEAMRGIWFFYVFAKHTNHSVKWPLPFLYFMFCTSWFRLESILCGFFLQQTSSNNERKKNLQTKKSKSFAAEAESINL